MATQKYEFVIVGSAAGGATLARAAVRYQLQFRAANHNGRE
jgi:choline dehydrogenase-like flavoprotein